MLFNRGIVKIVIYRVELQMRYIATAIPVQNHLTELVRGKFEAWQEPKSPCYVRWKPLVRGSLIGLLLA
jgi:hypothetical protein